MSKVITFSRIFPTYHPKRGQPTYFVEKLNKSLDPKKYRLIFGDETESHFKGFGVDFSFDVYKKCSPKHHTIRAGYRWEIGEKFSPRVWSGKPYNSKQVVIAPDIEIVKIYDFKITPAYYYVDNNSYCLNKEFDLEIIGKIAKNDGLEYDDLLAWFKHPSDFEGQILIWNKEVNYGQ